MEVIKQMMAQRAALGLDNSPHTTSTTSKVSKPVEVKSGSRQTLKQLRGEIVSSKKPVPKKVKKYIVEAIERLTAESSDDEDI